MYLINYSTLHKISHVKILWTKWNWLNKHPFMEKSTVLFPLYNSIFKQPNVIQPKAILQIDLVMRKGWSWLRGGGLESWLGGGVGGKWESSSWGSWAVNSFLLFGQNLLLFQPPVLHILFDMHCVVGHFRVRLSVVRWVFVRVVPKSLQHGRYFGHVHYNFIRVESHPLAQCFYIDRLDHLICWFLCSETRYLPMQILKFSPKQPNYWWVMILMHQFSLFLLKLQAILFCPLIFFLIIIFRIEIHQSHQNNLNWNDVLL